MHHDGLSGLVTLRCSQQDNQNGFHPRGACRQWGWLCFIPLTQVHGVSVCDFPGLEITDVFHWTLSARRPRLIPARFGGQDHVEVRSKLIDQMEAKNNDFSSLLDARCGNTVRAATSIYLPM